MHFKILARRSCALLVATLPLSVGSAQEPIPDTRLFLVVPGEEAPRVIARPLADGQSLTLELGPGGDALGVVLPPFAPGISGEVLQAGSTLAVTASLEAGRLSLNEAGAAGRVLAGATLEELASFRLRVSLVGAGGRASSWLVDGWRDVRPDPIGPPLDMFGGMFPLAEGDWLMSTEVRRADPGPATLGEVPLLRSGSHLFTPFDGERWFLIDTAAASTVLVPETLPEGVEIEPATMTERSAAGTRVLDATPPQGATGAVGGLLGSARCPVLAIGALEFREADVRVLAELPAIDGKPLAGILGIDLLSRCAALELSFAREGAGRLRLLDGTAPPAEPDLRLPIARVHRLVFVRGAIGATPVHLAVDSGSSYDFLIDRCASLAPALEPRESVEFRGLGDQPERAPIGCAPSLVLGEREFADQRLVLAALPVFAGVPAPHAVGVLGTPFLTRFSKLRVDFHAEELQLTF